MIKKLTAYVSAIMLCVCMVCVSVPYVYDGNNSYGQPEIMPLYFFAPVECVD